MKDTSHSMLKSILIDNNSFLREYAAVDNNNSLTTAA